MTCRLFIDEVGNDDLDHPAERYLSLTGIIAKLRGCDNRITPQIEAAKAEFFGHAPPNNTIVLHRRELVRKEGPFATLRDNAVNALWEERVLDLVAKLPYLAITVMIDKHAHKDKYKVWQFNPYHYCMTALIERYVMWLKTHSLTGDVLAEPRYKRADTALKRAFQYIYNNGTDHVTAAEVQAQLTSRELKFEPKKSNVCGLQLVELIAHPSHHGTKAHYAGGEIAANFGGQIYALLEKSKYRRNPKSMKIDGWGQKWLP